MKAIGFTSYIALLLLEAGAFSLQSSLQPQREYHLGFACRSIERCPASGGQQRANHVLLRMSSAEEEEEEEEVEPGKMRVSEIKAELDMRGVSYADCFDKESLAERLTKARLSGLANPDLIDKFNKQRVSFANMIICFV